MDFKKKLRVRLYVAIAYVVVGVLLIVLFSGLVLQNSYVLTLGIALAAVGALQLCKYFRITKNEERMHSRQVAEEDERNVSIAHRARSAAFTAYMLLACAASVVLGVIGRTDVAQMLGGQVCVMLLLYLFCHGLIRNKS